jgi:hypothetical protein
MFSVQGLARGEWMELTRSTSREGAEITAAVYRDRGWTCRVVEG